MNCVGHGKIILFGEHFVVHGQPAIVAALPQTTMATVKLSDNHSINSRAIRLIDNRPKIPGFRPTKSIEYSNMVKAICTHLNIQNNIEITLGGDLVVTSGGIGASAAAATAITNALNIFYSLNLTDEQIYYTALEGEKSIHGSPSGIDNMAALRGDIFSFQKNIDLINSNPIVQPTKTLQPIFLVCADSGIPSNTKKAISDFKKNISNYQETLIEYENIYTLALNALKSGDLAALGKTMNSNHSLLQNLGVSCQKLDALVKKALDAGAIGAKLTGSGQGGLIIALAQNKHDQKKILRSVQNIGFFALKIQL